MRVLNGRSVSISAALVAHQCARVRKETIMLRHGLLITGLLLCAGCHAPIPSLSPWTSTATRVPAPGTGASGIADNYYPGTRQPAGGTTPLSGLSNQSTRLDRDSFRASDSARIADNPNRVPTTPSSNRFRSAPVVQPGDANGGRSNSGGSGDVIRIVEPPPSGAANSLKLNGMTVSDSTQEAPQRFQSAGFVQMSSLPSSDPMATRRIRGAGTLSFPRASRIRGGSTSLDNDSQWRSKFSSSGDDTPLVSRRPTPPSA